MEAHTTSTDKRWSALRRTGVLNTFISKHVRFIEMADRRAQVMITINAFLIPFVASQLHVGEYRVTIIVFMVFALLSIYAAVISLLPKHYRWSSYWYLRNPAKRPSFMDVSGCLEAAGGLADTSAGHKQYADYLAWLAADSPAQKELMFDRMCQGWAIGSKDFKKGLLEEEAERLKAMQKDGDASNIKRAHYDGEDLREANELKWELYLERGLAELGKTSTSIREDLKSAQWKVLLSAVLKRSTSATNVWITKKLNMGIPQAVSQNVGKFNAAGGDKDACYKKLIIRITE